MQPWRSPQEIGGAHGSNQLPDLPGNAGVTNPWPTALPFPVESKSFSMPGDDCGRLDMEEGIPPFGPKPGEKDPQDSISSPEPEPFLVASLHYAELVAQRQDFELYGGPSPERTSEGSEK